MEEAKYLSESVHSENIKSGVLNLVSAPVWFYFIEVSQIGRKSVFRFLLEILPNF